MLLPPLPPLFILQVGNDRPCARSWNSCRMGGTHCGIAFHFGAARQSKTVHPSTAWAEGGMPLANASARTVWIRFLGTANDVSSFRQKCHSLEGVGLAAVFTASRVGRSHM